MADNSVEDRKRKLQEIRAKAQKGAALEGNLGDGQAPDAATSEEHQEKKIKFRNYQPYDNSLKKAAMEAEQVDKAVSTVAATELLVGSHAEVDAIKKELQQFQDNELNIMPKKPNWDLKVQVEGKLQKLKNRTQKAIVEILREKLAAEAQEEE
jgi:coiled-coil domain-containing protein 12